MKREKWQKGAGEFIGFSITVVFLIYLFILIVSFCIAQTASEEIENAVAVISRDIVTCESIKEAQEQAQKEAELFLGKANTIPSESIKAYVEYSPGSPQKWTKGSFVDVYISAKIKTNEPLTSRTKEVRAMVMVETEGGE